MLTTEAGQFVNVIATIDRVGHVGKILYVNPSTLVVVSTAPAVVALQTAAPFDGYALSLQDSAGKELALVPAAVQLSGCGPQPPDTALIQQDLALLPEMRQIALLRHGVELDRFVAGPASRGDNQGMAPAGPVSKIVAGAPVKAHRIPLHVDPAPAHEPGITYTVQVRVPDASAWHTIAVGIDTPRVDLDRNQFAGATRLAMRFLRTNGLADAILAEQEIDLR